MLAWFAKRAAFQPRLFVRWDCMPQIGDEVRVMRLYLRDGEW